MSHARDEVEAAVTRLIKLRDRVSDGDGCWADLAPMFTDDVVYIDPAWGRIEGIEAVRAEVLGEAMDGLDWRFPTDLYLIDGDTVLIKWRQVIPGADGTDYEQSGFSHLIYAGDGKFRYNEDQLNMAHVIEDLGASGWRPPAGMKMAMPPTSPNRDFSIPDRS